MWSESFRDARKILILAVLPLVVFHEDVHAVLPLSPTPEAPESSGSEQNNTAEGQKKEAASPETAKPSGDASPGEQRKPVVQKVGKSMYRIGSVTVDTKERLVTFPARINLREGVLEVLICTEYGKTHESLLSTKVNPLHLNVAFLLLGLEGGHAVKYQGDPTKPVGNPVEIWFKLKEGDKEKTVRAEDWVYNNHANRPMLHTHWVYVGSVLTEDGFMAQREGQIATTFHDPFTLIDNPLPGGGDDTVYTPNTKQLPPLRTELTVSIKCGPVRRWEPPLPGASR